MRTWTTRARRTTKRKSKNLPTDYDKLLQTTSSATYNLYGLRQQCPGTRRPSGLVKMLHNDNVVLTQVCCCRHNATTTAPATTSNFDEDEDGCTGRGRRTSAVLRPGPTYFYVSTSSANNTIVTAASSGGRPCSGAERMTMRTAAV